MAGYTFSYKYNDNIYINLTNQCSNDCAFCVRNHDSFSAEGYDLWLKKEPTVQDVIDSISMEDFTKANEIVFCGYGEPTYKINEIAALGKYFKALGKVTRINTNGQGNLIHKKDITPLFKDAIDIVNVSLNDITAEGYQKTCKSIYGEKAFDELLDFALKSKLYVPRVILSVVDVLGAEKINKGREIAQKLNLEYRVRKYI